MIALAVTVASVRPDRIDRVGLQPCNRDALRRAVKTLEVPPDYVILDALPLRRLPFPAVEALVSGIDKLPETVRAAVRNNGGGHANHSLFWPVMSPNGGGDPEGKLASAIDADLGGLAQFKEAFTKALGTGNRAWFIAARFAQDVLQPFADNPTVFIGGTTAGLNPNFGYAGIFPDVVRGDSISWRARMISNGLSSDSTRAALEYLQRVDVHLAQLRELADHLAHAQHHPLQRLQVGRGAAGPALGQRIGHAGAVDQAAGQELVQRRQLHRAVGDQLDHGAAGAEDDGRPEGIVRHQAHAQDCCGLGKRRAYEEEYYETRASQETPP